LIFTSGFVFKDFMKADVRISVKDYSRGKNLKVELVRLPFGRQFLVRMNGAKWPADDRSVSLSKVFSSLRVRRWSVVDADSGPAVRRA
jgi:hypothetical protein